jgi:diaminopimelate epimerase
MNTPISFTKASGAGNDFIIVNNIKGDVLADFSLLAKAVCDRHFGVGGDGLLVVEKSVRADFSMKYFNADGSWGGMCGNGGRCIARFAYREGIAGLHQRFDALDHVYDAVIEGESVKLGMKDSAGYRSEFPLLIEGSTLPVWFVNTGSPHVVTFPSDLDRIDVQGLGKAIRSHPAFSPEGTNVNFVTQKSGDLIEIRTYERGVEAETQACGTGSVASALVASHRFGMKSPVRVAVRSGEQLLIAFSGPPGRWNDIRLEGSAHLLFSGSLMFGTEPPTISVLS